MSSTQLMDVDTASRAQLPVDQDMELEDQVKWFDLMPDRKLLDASFEGYKLSLDAFTQYRIELKDARQVDSHSPLAGEYQQKMVVYQHLKLFSLQNRLFVNPYADSLAYYFDSELRLTRVNYCLPGLVPARQLVSTSFQIPNADELRRTKLDRVDVTMRFLSETLAVVFDGFDTLYLIETSRKSLDDISTENWTVLFRWTANAEVKCLSSIVKDALIYESQLHVLLMNVNEVVGKGGETSKYETYVHWVTLDRAGESWVFKRLRRVNCKSCVPEYVSLETNGRGINITGPRHIGFDYDSARNGEIKPKRRVVPKQTQQDDAKMESAHVEPLYTWTQTPEEIVVKIRSYETKIDKKSLKVNIRTSHLEVRLSDDAILDSELFATVKPDESTWTLNENTVELTLTKASTVTWTSLLKVDDKRGEYKMADEMLSNPPFTSERPVAAVENKPLFSLEQQLEECDGLVDDQIMANTDEEKLTMIRRIDGETYADSHQSYINDNKVLFDVRLSANKSPAVCLRHDVDGILWQPHRVSAPSPSETVWLTHEHTFKAFGYVQASKQESKFCLCSPNKAYVCVCDTQKHIYVYKQAADIFDSNLRNRKTGQAVKHVAKQYLISLDSDKEILGFYCSNDHILALTSETVYIYKTN